MLKLIDINVSIGKIKILYNVSFNLDQHECVALLGSNGAGKSTTLKTISGLINPVSGDITFNNKSIIRVNASDRVKLGIVQVPEGGRLFPYLTVEENLKMGASGMKQSWNSMKESMERVFSLFPILKERRSLPARLLSGGERQMLAIGRGLMSKPSVLMIDEPSIGLAPKILIEIYTTLRSLHDSGATILLSEQNVKKALSLANRGYVMENGRIVMEGTSNELLNSDHVKTAYLGV